MIDLQEYCNNLINTDRPAGNDLINGNKKSHIAKVVRCCFVIIL